MRACQLNRANIFSSTGNAEMTKINVQQQHRKHPTRTNTYRQLFASTGHRSDASVYILTSEVTVRCEFYTAGKELNI